MIATMLILACLCILAPTLYLIYKPSLSLIEYLQRRWPDVLWHVATPSKIIALTIDDSPTECTDEIMEILKTYEATATFFIIGSYITGRESTLRNLIRNGNELGNHAMFSEPSRSLSDASLAYQLQSVEELIDTAYAAVHTEPPPRYFRPGSGFFSSRMLNLVGGMGYRMVLGSIYPYDPQIPFWRINASHILSMLHPGAIVICHDRSWTIPMLRDVLPKIRQKGYRIVTITDLLKECKL
ncbi:hypothetical protein ASPVEDRAFT_27459 [Aspergillus versicolor CBS 583.65]|uniref:chitin deacetylase n=1 Tax=Aspergillus versicolor CBS 583.65 TaxID=1036611 RepID=A0A1L9PGV9_ASPVE|nr:uncharacterized protein ASPVEDRAFT_27459 [Aspergillus versicolor CBS 583.65]OJJ00748.1 hypothetical protein ASPVEDRAFT_27459 [Aspergillus versicolor CBS 583.65]